MRNLTDSIKFLFLLFTILISLCSQGQNQYGKYIDINGAFGTFVPHKPAVRHLQNGPSLIGEIAYTLRTDGSKFHHKPYKLPYYGLVLGIEDGGYRKVIGMEAYLTTFGAIPLYPSNNPFVVKMGIGLGYVQGIYNKYTNPTQDAIGSHLNVNIQLRLEKNFSLFGKGGVNFGMGISHYSNASYQTPNLGLNYFHLYLGKRLTIQKCIPVSDTVPVISILPYAPNKIEFELNGGVKENAVALGDKFLILKASGHYVRQLSIKHAWSNGIDIYYNKALQYEEDILLQIGLSSLYVLNFDDLKIGAGLGFYLLGKPQISRAFYSSVFVQYYFNNKIFLKLNMRTHRTIADFFTLGIGYRL